MKKLASVVLGVNILAALAVAAYIISYKFTGQEQCYPSTGIYTALPSRVEKINVLISAYQRESFGVVGGRPLPAEDINRIFEIFKVSLEEQLAKFPSCKIPHIEHVDLNSASKEIAEKVQLLRALTFHVRVQDIGDLRALTVVAYRPDLGWFGLQRYLMPDIYYSRILYTVRSVVFSQEFPMNVDNMSAGFWWGYVFDLGPNAR